MCKYFDEKGDLCDAATADYSPFLIQVLVLQTVPVDWLEGAVFIVIFFTI